MDDDGLKALASIQFNLEVLCNRTRNLRLQAKDKRIKNLYHMKDQLFKQVQLINSVLEDNHIDHLIN